MAVTQAGGYHIRPGTPEDGAALIPLVHALNRSHGDPTELTEPVLRTLLTTPGRGLEVLVAEADGELVGYLFSLPAFESAYASVGRYVSDLYVAPPWRRQGVGRALVAAAAARLLQCGLGHLWWVSRAENAAAHAFYRTIECVSMPLKGHALFGPGLAALAQEGTASPPL